MPNQIPQWVGCRSSRFPSSRLIPAVRGADLTADGRLHPDPAKNRHFGSHRKPAAHPLAPALGATRGPRRRG